MSVADASRTPVLVGVGAVKQRDEDPTVAREPVALMIEALERAADDAGSRTLLERADCILVPRGFWDYHDPGRLVAEKIGASRARTVVAEIGLLQTMLFGRAARAIVDGEAQIVLVVGGEARYRALRAHILSSEAPLTCQSEQTAPDVVLRPIAVNGEWHEFDRPEKFIEVGRWAAEAQLNRIKALMKRDAYEKSVPQEELVVAV